MAQVGDKVQWKIRRNRRGKLIVCGLEETYKGHTNEEIRKLMKSVDGQNVIEGYVSEVDEKGNATEFGVPAFV